MFQDVDLGIREFYEIENYFCKNLIQNANFDLQPMNIASAFVSSLSPTFVRNSDIPHWKTRGPYQREKPPIGTEGESIPIHILEKNGIADIKNMPAIVTSYSGTQQYQDIVLSDLRISEKVMDEIQPVIVAEEWIGTRFDCGNSYILELQLFRKNCDRPVHTKSLHINTRCLGNGVWRKVCLTMGHYGKGVRKIRFIRKGQDNQFWAGFYGTKFAFCRVHLQLPKANYK
ncbi:Hypothetical predicted protein [Cloeon dipterum]|uniref:FBA domain-containing protein n=1 Tax=Cloeon dipterum TaxID=197152 RepID=A0A8S1CNK3_9INSE|nr:Hypothetical predicted protein [Cloeon dipterum]